jgi:hypothetical protein
MSKKTFLSAFNITKDWILNEPILNKRKEKEIPAQYIKTSHDGRLHFFLIGQENKGYDQVSISVCIQDIPEGIRLEDEKIYKISISEFQKSKRAETNSRLQSYNINWEFISNNQTQE